MLPLKWRKKEKFSNKILQGGLLSLLLFVHSSFTLSSPLKVAILDTGFCLEKLNFPKNITIHKSIDLTKSNNFKCSNLDPNDRRLHGNWVLAQLIKEITIKKDIEITPFIVFDKFAKQDPNSWLKAFKIQQQFHLFIIATGVTDLKRLNSVGIETPLFVAGATIGRGIGYKTILWPQSQFKNPLVFTIGSYIKSSEGLAARPDYTLIHPSQMKYFLPAGSVQSSFNGSSKATATAAARAINYCYDKFVSRKEIESCLTKYAKEVEILNDSEKIQIKSL